MKKLYHPGRPCNILLEDVPLRLEDLGERLEIVQCSNGFGIFSDSQFWISNQEFEDSASVLAKSKIFFAKNKFNDTGWFFYNPLELEVELTRDCNQDCIHCWNDSNDKQGSLNFSLARRVVDEFRTYGGQKIKITGGEPLKYSNLEDFLKHCKLTGVRELEMTSNGSLIKKTEASYLANYLSLINISIHGTNSEVHDLITKRSGSFQRAVGAVSYLQENGLNPRINFTVTRQNMAEVLKMINFVSDLKARGLRFILLRNVGHGSRLEPLTKQDASYLKTQIYRVSKESDVYIEKSELFPSGYNSGIGDYRFYGCNGLRSMGYISSNGYFFPCSIVDKPVGNVNVNSISKIWSGELANKFRSNGKYSCCPVSNCSIRDICGGTCRV